MTIRKFTVTDVNSRVPIPSIDLEMATNNNQQNQQSEETQKMNIYRSTDANHNHEIDDGLPKPNSNHNFTIDDTNPTNGDNSPELWKKFRKDWPISSQQLGILLIALECWGIAWSIFGDVMAPSSPYMRILFLFGGGQICGVLVGLTGLPDMLGMLFWGVFYKNVGLGEFTGLEKVEAILRELALVNIMLLAGLGLDMHAFKKLLGMVTRLTLIPTIAEVAIITVLSYFLLNLPWLWGILLGLVVTAVSPNVVVTLLLKLKEERLGLYKGIHTIIIAMTTCNDVVAIFFFGVFLSIVFSTGRLQDQLLQGPIGIGIGIVYGFITGLVLCFMPSNKAKYMVGVRFVLMFVAGVFSVLGSKAIQYPSAGALGCITISFVAGTGWRKHTGKEDSEVGVYLDVLWKFLKPISFSLIGKEVYFKMLDGNTVLYGIIILVVGSILRLGFAYASSYGGELNWKERAYITISSFPKATVQAALGPVALDLARQLKSTEHIDKANTILIVSVLAIILTAPLGAVLMTKFSTKWLKRSPVSEHL